MSTQKATAILEHFSKLTHRTTQIGPATDDNTDPSSQTRHATQTPTHNRTNDENANPPGQSPEPTVPSAFAKKIQDILPTFSSFSSSIGSPRFTPSTPQTGADETPLPDPHLPASSTPPNFENGTSEHGWQSFWSAFDRLRPSQGKKTEAAGSPEPSQGEVLDCVDDNNSIMMYGPLEPDETSEVEIACSEIVSINGDGEEIRTPQSSYSPLPSESFDDSVVVGSPARSPLSRFIPLPFESIDQVMSGGGGRSPQPRFSPLPLESVNRILRGGRSPPPRFVPLSPGSIDQVLTSGGDNDLESEPVPEYTEMALVPVTTGLAGGQPPVKEYRVWLPSLTKISVQTMWWGFRMYVAERVFHAFDAIAYPSYLPPPVLDVLNNRQLEAVKRAAIITTALQWLMDNLPVALLPPQVRPGVTILRHLVPYVGYMGGFIAWSWSAIRSFDKGMVVGLPHVEL